MKRAVPTFLRTAILLLLIAVSGSGCAFVFKGPSVMTDSLMGQSDAEIVRNGAPAYLILMDALVASSPGNQHILLASSDANTAYAAAFLSGDEPERASIMYAKARDYALRVLRKRRAFRRMENGSISEFEAGVKKLGKRDVPAMYSAATAWLGWIINSGSMEATAQLSRALALMQRVLDLSPGYQHGGPEMFFGIYYAVQPRGAGRDLEKSKKLFEESIAFADGKILLPRVAYAEFWARYAFDRKEFERILETVLEDEHDPAEYRLMNAVARERARRLLEEADDIF